MRSVCKAACIAALGIFIADLATAADRAGSVKKLQRDAFQMVTSIGEPLDAGDAVYRDAELYTREYGTVEVLLDDGTDLLLGPNANVKLDKYVYDGGTGSMSLSLARGAIRLISGRMPKENYAFTSTIAHIGIRGTRLWLDRDTPDLLKIWTDEGVVTARPVQSTEVFTFVAPVYAECTVLTCEIVPAPPPPVKYPLDPRGFWNE